MDISYLKSFNAFHLIINGTLGVNIDNCFSEPPLFCLYLLYFCVLIWLEISDIGIKKKQKNIANVISPVLIATIQIFYPPFLFR